MDEVREAIPFRLSGCSECYEKLLSFRQLPDYGCRIYHGVLVHMSLFRGDGFSHNP